MNQKVDKITIMRKQNPNFQSIHNKVSIRCCFKIITRIGLLIAITYKKDPAQVIYSHSAQINAQCLEPNCMHHTSISAREHNCKYRYVIISKAKTCDQIFLNESNFTKEEPSSHSIILSFH